MPMKEQSPQPQSAPALIDLFRELPSSWRASAEIVHNAGTKKIAGGLWSVDYRISTGSLAGSQFEITVSDLAGQRRRSQGPDGASAHSSL